MMYEIEGLLSRDIFRARVFERDGHQCIFCGEREGLDAHHILERRLWPDGGYYTDNGATVCQEHHLACERTEISCEEVRAAAKIRNVLLPPHLYEDTRYDKWGNPYLPNSNVRMPGELYEDESVRKILAGQDFQREVKYPRTYHLPWSPGKTKDDRTLSSLDVLSGEEIVVTEKLDGECLAGSTKVAMADGTFLTIAKIVRNDLRGASVLAVRDGRVVPAKILRTYNNGRTETWTRITLRGVIGPRRALYCTQKEKFFVPNVGYVEARELSVGTKVCMRRTGSALTGWQSSVLLGKLLGDGSLHIAHDTASVQFSHKKDHIDYVKWTLAALGSVGRKFTGYTSGFGTPMIKAWTANNYAILQHFRDFTGKSKQVPSWVSDALDPCALAFWYMDDGTLQRSPKQRDRMILSTCGFNEDSCNVLVLGLRNLGIRAKTMLDKIRGYWYIYISAHSVQRMGELIRPFVPTCMQYKLPENLRGHVPVLPRFDEAPPLHYTRESEVVQIEHDVKYGKWGQYHTKFDIETETGNFFANDVLVHNCTSLYPHTLHARSLEYAPRADRDRMKALHASIACDIPEGYRVCGENVWARHSIPYENLSTFFYAYGMWKGLTCLSWDESVEWFSLLGLQHVPVLYEGPYDEMHLKDLTSRLNFDKQEGYVVRPRRAFKLREFPYCVGKYVRAEHVRTQAHWTRRIVPNGFRP